LSVTRRHRWGFPCCVGFLASMPSPVPRRDHVDLIALPLPSWGRRHVPRGGGLPRSFGGSAPTLILFEACSAFTHVTACLLAESPCDPFHRKLRRFRHLHRRSDCFRLERLAAGRGLHPLDNQRHHGARRVEVWRGGLGFGLLLFQGFPVCGAISACHAPFPHPAHRTGRAVFPHPALGQGGSCVRSREVVPRRPTLSCTNP
jgi:hypothetical protein